MTNNNKIQLSNIKSSQDYEDYLKAHIKAYCVSEFLGRGKYNTTYFKHLSTANKDLLLFLPKHFFLTGPNLFSNSIIFFIFK